MHSSIELKFTNHNDLHLPCWAKFANHNGLQDRLAYTILKYVYTLRCSTIIAVQHFYRTYCLGVPFLHRPPFSTYPVARRSTVKAIAASTARNARMTRKGWRTLQHGWRTLGYLQVRKKSKHRVIYVINIPAWFPCTLITLSLGSPWGSFGATTPSSDPVFLSNQRWVGQNVERPFWNS